MDAQALQEIWKKTLPLIEKSVTQVTFEVTIMSISPYSYENTILTLTTRDEFFKPTINKR